MDADKTLHIDAVKVCRQFGIPPTPANQDMVLQELQKVVDTYAKKHGTTVKIEERNDG